MTHATQSKSSKDFDQISFQEIAPHTEATA